MVHHVSGYGPIHGSSREFAAERPAETNIPARKAAIPDNSSASPWQLLATIPGATLHDISFATALVGFAASENGQIWKTSDGGNTWSEVLSLQFPYEWFGVHAFDANNVIISGFNDQSFNNGIIRWSQDGGQTWSGDIQVSNTTWAYRIRFSNPTLGLILDEAATAQYTTDGGAAAGDWSSVNENTDGTWFGNQFSLLPDGHAATSGIDYCSSSNTGGTWSCGPSIDQVFDGASFFYDDDHGWVGSGEISPNVEGWLHRTTDGGKTWSARTLNSPWPIREIRFVSPTIGWAAGGNVWSSVGGIEFSMDGGQTWALDVDSNGHEMGACDSQPVNNSYQVWCAGFSGTDSVVYSVQGASTPTFSPQPGNFTGETSVTLASTTANAAIYYTTDGSDPTTASTLYNSPIPINSSATISVIAAAPGLAPSVAAIGAYTIATPQLQFNGTPLAITVVGGSSASANLSLQATGQAANVTLSCTGLPSIATCSFSPPSLTATTQASAVTVTVTSGALTAASRARAPATACAFTLPWLLFGWWGIGLSKHRGRLGFFLIVTLAAAVALTVSACGSGGGGQSKINPIQAVMTITASAPNANSATIQIPVTINP